MNLKTKMYISMLSIFLVTLALLVGNAYLSTRSTFGHSAEEFQLAQSRELAAMVDEWSLSRKNGITIMAKELSANWDAYMADLAHHRSAGTMAAAEIIGDMGLTANVGGFDVVYFGAEADGGFYPSRHLDLPADFDPRVRPWYEQGKRSSGASQTLPYRTATRDAGLILSFMHPVTAHGQFRGVLSSNVWMDTIVQSVLSRTIGESGYFFLVHKDGTILAHHQGDLVLQKKLSDIDPSLSRTIADMQQASQGIASFRENGREKLLAYSALESMDWFVMVAIDRSEVYAPVISLLGSQITIAVMALIAGALIIVFLLRALLRPIDALIYRLRDIAEGDADLTQQLDESRRDELGTLAHLFNLFIQRIRRIMLDIDDLSHHVASSSSELSSTVSVISEGIDEQSAKTGELAAAIEQMNQTISQIAANATDTAERAQEMQRGAGESQQSVMATVENMLKIADGAKASMEVIQELGDSSLRIGEIVNVINDIADQTNLLALNAAIEAARAGDSGRGFAVVADEVRKLAERTQAATREISEMVSKFQAQSKDAVDKVAADVDRVEVGAQSADQAGESINQIMGNVTTTTGMITQIASAAEEQAATTNEIARNVERINAIADSSARELVEISNSSTQLSKVAEELRSTVMQFKLQETTIAQIAAATNSR